MASNSSQGLGSRWPAPYGRSCGSCARAKCKCFYRAEGSVCERCHRLGKDCEPSASSRKRNARTQRQKAARPSELLEEKVDDLVSLLRGQAVARRRPLTPRPLPTDQHTTPVHGTSAGHQDRLSGATACAPDVSVDVTGGVVHLERPGGAAAESPVFQDVCGHDISERAAEELLGSFRCAFLATFPFVHITVTMSAEELRRQKPFLWLVIMALGSNAVSQQFAIAETIWDIISRRIVSQHCADLDLLLGVICFGSWSHYFKQDRPFMTMLAQIAVTIAFELNLHKDVAEPVTQRGSSGPVLSKQPRKQRCRTIEERRTILALYHLTSSTWSTYRKTEPLRWTSYLDDCLRMIGEGEDSPLDSALAAQVKCQIIANQLTCALATDSLEEGAVKAPPAVLVAALLRQLNKIRQDLPDHVRLERTVQLYLLNAQVSIQGSLLGSQMDGDQSGLSQSRRLRDLEAVLASLELWFAELTNMPLTGWVGMNVDVFAQLTHCLVVLFKLATLNEPEWDLDSVWKRANALDILDHCCDAIDQVPGAMGMVDAEGPRSGIFFKTSHMLRGIKALFLAEMPAKVLPRALHTSDDGGGVYDAGEYVGYDSIPDDFFLNLSDEPWLSDILGF